MYNHFASDHLFFSLHFIKSHFIYNFIAFHRAQCTHNHEATRFNFYWQLNFGSETYYYLFELFSKYIRSTSNYNNWPFTSKHTFQWIYIRRYAMSMIDLFFFFFKYNISRKRTCTHKKLNWMKTNDDTSPKPTKSTQWTVRTISENLTIVVTTPHRIADNISVDSAWSLL